MTTGTPTLARQVATLMQWDLSDKPPSAGKLRDTALDVIHNRYNAHDVRVQDFVGFLLTSADDHLEEALRIRATEAFLLEYVVTFRETVRCIHTWICRQSGASARNCFPTVITGAINVLANQAISESDDVGHAEVVAKLLRSYVACDGRGVTSEDTVHLRHFSAALTKYLLQTRAGTLITFKRCAMLLQPIQSVANEGGVGWNFVGEITHKALSMMMLRRQAEVMHEAMIANKW